MLSMTAYIMVGVPGSGKSTEAKKLARIENAVVISEDAIRLELYDTEEEPGNWNEIANVIEEQVEEAAYFGRNVIIDCPHYTTQQREEAIALLRSYGYAKVEAWVMNPSLQRCLERNANRKRKMPEYIIKEMYQVLERSLKNIFTEDFDRMSFIL